MRKWGHWWDCPYTGMRAFMLNVLVPVFGMAALAMAAIWLMFGFLS